MTEHPYRRHIAEALGQRSSQAAADGAFRVLIALDDIQHPADKLLALVTAFKFVAESCGFEWPFGELMQHVDKREADCRYRQVNTLSAVRRYAENEIERKLR